MDHRTLKQYVTEVQTQCQYATVAMKDLSCASETQPGEPGPDLDRCFAAAQALLMAAAAVSRLMWPISKATFSTERGKALRSALGVGEIPVLQSRQVRDSLEHFDERMDVFFQSEHTNIVDRIYGPANAFMWAPGVEPPPYWRHIDPQAGTFAVLSRGVATDAVNLLELFQALVEVNQRAQEWLAVTRRPPGQG